MNKNEYESYLRTFDLHLAKQDIEDQLEMYEKCYTRLEQISWDVRSKMHDIEQQQDRLVTELQALNDHIRILEQ
ncbi:MAG: hypothetical protein WHX52_02705 [Anaerolineae bacterium]